MDPTLVLNNVVALAKGAKIYKVPNNPDVRPRGARWTAVEQLTDIYPEQTPIDRTFINAWEDKRVVDAVKATGRKKLINRCAMDGNLPCVSDDPRARDGYDVYVVTDASGGVSTEAHERGITRWRASRCGPMTWMAVTSEWQRDWARAEYLDGVAELLLQHGGSSGTSFAWEMQLLTQGAKN